jgi:hypothetical protein
MLEVISIFCEVLREQGRSCLRLQAAFLFARILFLGMKKEPLQALSGSFY